MIDLSELRDSAQKAFPADKLVPERDAAWALAAKMGWLMIELPEDQGGLGLGRNAAATIHYELGKVLSSAPLIPAMLALRAIFEAEDFADKESWIERICGGEYVPLNMLPGKLKTAADGSLSGKVSGYFDADMASHLLVGAAGSYLLVPADAAGVRLEEKTLWDESRRLFDLHLDSYAPDPMLSVAVGVAGAPLHDSIARSAHLFVAADSLGGATAGLDLAVDYLKMRKQFDRPLAMFQALKHRCADLKSQIVSAEALLWSRAAGAATVSVTALGAMKGYATDSYRIVTEDMIQLHGGIGLTEEHPCHLFMKRAMLNLQLCGPLDHWREMAGREALELTSV